ncbi:hypothetical protein Tco_0389148, partial [Tanacetum coccineum]
MDLECYGGVNEVDNDRFGRLWGLAGNGVGEVQCFKTRGEVKEDNTEIPPFEDIHEDTTDGIFTHSSYDDEGAVADFTNLETVVNVSL